MRVYKSESSKMNMCAECYNEFGSCMPNHIKFGDGFGNDNVIECSEYVGNQNSWWIHMAPELGVIKHGKPLYEREP